MGYVAKDLRIFPIQRHIGQIIENQSKEEIIHRGIVYYHRNKQSYEIQYKLFLPPSPSSLSEKHDIREHKPHNTDDADFKYQHIKRHDCPLKQPAVGYGKLRRIIIGMPLEDSCTISPNP